MENKIPIPIIKEWKCICWDAYEASAGMNMKHPPG